MWLETTKEVYELITKTHKEQLEIFASYTDLTGNDYIWSSGKPEIMTEWGLKNATNPLCKIILSKEYIKEKNWKRNYFLFYL